MNKFICAAICLILACALTTTVNATTIMVSNTNDSGPGSLRQTLLNANNGDTIDATGISGAITLTSGELLVDKSVTINGAGADELAVDGNATSTVFQIGSGKIVTISGLTIRNGQGNFGGGILNGDSATLTIINSTLSGNTGGNGGGSFNSGTLSVINSTVSSNIASEGAGIYNSGAGSLTIINSTLGGNTAGSVGNPEVEGGGIFNGGTLTIFSSTVTANTAGGISGAGGGIYNGGTLTILNSTVSANTASTGGGVHNAAAATTVTITNSTFSGNAASAYGGACFNGGTMQIANSTLSGNSASTGGGILVFGPLQIGNTILNRGEAGANIGSFGEVTVTSLGYNLSSDDAGGHLTSAGDQINTDPVLGPLQDNGGPTFTHALLRGSPAIDAGDPSFTPPPRHDQRGRGFARVAHGRIDVGSFEVQRRH